MVRRLQEVNRGFSAMPLERLSQWLREIKAASSETSGLEIDSTVVGAGELCQTDTIIPAGTWFELGAYAPSFFPRPRSRLLPGFHRVVTVYTEIRGFFNFLHCVRLGVEVVQGGNNLGVRALEVFSDRRARSGAAAEVLGVIYGSQIASARAVPNEEWVGSLTRFG